MHDGVRLCEALHRLEAQVLGLLRGRVGMRARARGRGRGRVKVRVRVRVRVMG